VALAGGARGGLESRGVFAIVDIETRVDKTLVKSVLHREEDLSDEDAYAETRARITARSSTGSDFFPVSFHVPVSIVVGDVDDERVLTKVHVLGAEQYSEAGIVTDFWNRLEEFRGTLVSFNGRGFDLPVLELAALRHGCRIPRYFGRNYRYRYSDESHYDLYDFLTNHGAYHLRGGFQLVSRLLGLPGKGPVDGASVQALWEAGRLADIHAYCRRDVIQTYFVFLRLELIRGRITQEQHAAALAATASFRSELDV
jgi:predicted PolB exonuclease-like 3'-5' exonuclease